MSEPETEKRMGFSFLSLIWYLQAYSKVDQSGIFRTGFELCASAPKKKIH